MSVVEEAYVAASLSRIVWPIWHMQGPYSWQIAPVCRHSLGIFPSDCLGIIFGDNKILPFLSLSPLILLGWVG